MGERTQCGVALGTDPKRGKAGQRVDAAEISDSGVDSGQRRLLHVADLDIPDACRKGRTVPVLLDRRIWPTNPIAVERLAPCATSKAALSSCPSLWVEKSVSAPRPVIRL